MEILCSKISQSINELGSLLDHLYKLSYRQREDYYERIQSTKNRLLQIKSSLRQNNLIHSQKMYQQLYLTINMLKNEIQAKAILNQKKKVTTQVNKVNRSYCEKQGRSYCEKQTRQTRQIHVSTQMRQIQQDYKARQNLLKDQIAIYQTQIQQLKNCQSKLSVNSSDQICMLKQTIVKLQREISLLHENDKNNLDICDEAANEIKKLNSLLNESQFKLHRYQQLIKANQFKIKTLEQNQYHHSRQSQYTIERYQIKQQQLLKKIKQLEQNQFQIKKQEQQITSLEQAKKRSTQDIIILQNQIIKVETQNKQFKQLIQANQIKIDKLNSELESIAFASQKFRRLLSQKQQYLQKAQQKIQKLNYQLNKKSHDLNDYQKNLKQIQKNNHNMEQDLFSYQVKLKQLNELLTQQQANAVNFRMKLSKANDEISSLQHQLVTLKNINIQSGNQIKSLGEKNIYLEKEKTQFIKTIISLETTLKDYDIVMQKSIDEQTTQKIKIENLELTNINLAKQLDKVKKLYLRSKIQTIYSIRQCIL